MSLSLRSPLLALAALGLALLGCGGESKTNGGTDGPTATGGGNTARGGSGGASTGGSSGGGGTGGSSAGGSGGGSSTGGTGGSSTGGSGGGGSGGGMGGAGMGGSGGMAAQDARTDVVVDSGSPADTNRDGSGAGTMSFFVTSTGSGAMGGNLGGLAGADMKCKTLATAAGLGDKDWKAFLSTEAPAVSARDRIGAGPWRNQRGQMVAMNITTLLGGVATNLITDEKGGNVPGNQHDILTGSTAMGMPQMNGTCMNWTSTMGASRVGHSDGANTGSNRWSAHNSGCTQQGLIDTAGAGRIYCFATN